MHRQDLDTHTQCTACIKKPMRLSVNTVVQITANVGELQRWIVIVTFQSLTVLSVQQARGRWFLCCAVSDVCFRFIKPFSCWPEWGRGASLCWHCADLEWDADNFSKETAGTPQGEAPLPIPFICPLHPLYIPPAAFVCLSVWSAASMRPHSALNDVA